MSKPFDLVENEAVVFLVCDDSRKKRLLYNEACDFVEGYHDLDLYNFLILNPSDDPDKTGVALRNFIIDNIIWDRVGSIAMNSPEDFLYLMNTPLYDYIELLGPDRCPNVIFMNGTKDMSSYELLHSYLDDMDRDYHDAIKHYEVLEKFEPDTDDNKEYSIIGLLTYFSPESVDGISPDFESIPENCNVIDAAYKYNPIPTYSLNIEKALSENNLYVCPYTNFCISQKFLEKDTFDIWHRLCDRLFDSEELENSKIDTLMIIKVDSINTPVRELIHSKNVVTLSIKEITSGYEVETNALEENYSENFIKDIISRIKNLWLRYVFGRTTDALQFGERFFLYLRKVKGPLHSERSFCSKYVLMRKNINRLGKIKNHKQGKVQIDGVAVKCEINGKHKIVSVK